MAPFSLPSFAEEEAIHQARLFNVEERPFKRITKRVLALDTLTLNPPTQLPSPPPESDPTSEAVTSLEKRKEEQDKQRRDWREDALLDFASFESNIIRIQFLITSNLKERERYAQERIKIEKAAQSVKDNIGNLRVQLEQSQRTLALRKEYDEAAEKITSNRLLKPRDEQQHNIAKLDGEIAELNRESQEYAQTWAERREQFGKIIEEGMHLRRLIRDEKEEVERREGMEGQEDGEKGIGSGANTPKTDAASGATPMHSFDGEKEGGIPGGLTVETAVARGSSPLREVQGTGADQEVLPDAEDEAEDGELEASPMEGVVTLNGDKSD